MKNQEDKSSNNIGNHIQNREKSKDDNKGKSSQEKSCAAGPKSRLRQEDEESLQKRNFQEFF